LAHITGLSPSSVPVIAFYGVWAHGRRAWMLGVKRSRFAVRKVPPAIRFAQPLPAVLSVDRRAVTAQQLHLTTAYSVIHGHLPCTNCVTVRPLTRKRHEIGVTLSSPHCVLWKMRQVI